MRQLAILALPEGNCNRSQHSVRWWNAQATRAKRQ